MTTDLLAKVTVQCDQFYKTSNTHVKTIKLVLTGY